jgi:hypothetical protein
MNTPIPINPAQPNAVDSTQPEPVPNPLLDFTPVPRKVKRSDGWTPERQRRFIELLAETGSPQRAAVAMGKVLSGIEAVYREPGAESFRSAWHRAIEIADVRERSALAGMTDGPATNPPNRRGRGGAGGRSGGKFEIADEADEAAGMDEGEFIELIGRVVAKFTRKVAQERSARLAGDVVGADFTLRQITSLEVAFDMMCSGRGLNAWEKLYDLRRGEHSILQIAETEMSRILDDARRAQWVEMGEPPRPEHPPSRYLTDHGDHRTEDRPFEVGEDRPGREEEERVRAEMQAREAVAQIKWEKSQRKGGLPVAKRKKAPKALPAPAPYEEDFADQMMRKAMAAARKAHPEDFD